MFLKVVHKVNKNIVLYENYSVGYSKFSFHPKQIIKGQKNTFGSDRCVYGIDG